MKWPPTEDAALKIMMVVMVLGIADAAYLTYLEHLIEGGDSCPTESLPGLDCGEVLGSEWAYVLEDFTPSWFFDDGFAIAWIGLLGFILLLGLVLDRFLFMDLRRTRYHRVLIPLFGLMGIGLSIWLTYLEIFEIRQFCPFCVFGFAMDIIVTVLAVVVYRDYLDWFLNVKLFKRREVKVSEEPFEKEAQGA